MYLRASERARKRSLIKRQFTIPSDVGVAIAVSCPPINCGENACHRYETSTKKKKLEMLQPLQNTYYILNWRWKFRRKNPLQSNWYFIGILFLCSSQTKTLASNQIMYPNLWIRCGYFRKLFDLSTEFQAKKKMKIPFPFHTLRWLTMAANA